jgi:tetratricopeptide (TPR) repeat protein
VVRVPPIETARRAAIIHREMVQLAALIVVAALAFFSTRRVAAANHETATRDAREWYRRGQAAMAAGLIDDAADDFRRAAVRRRGDRTYGLALSQALAARGDTIAARRQLMALREAAPEDPDVNLALARLNAAGGDRDEAQRFYYNALYAPWPAEKRDARRAVRMELIRFLATHGETSRALSELLTVSAEVPENPHQQVELAALFSAAGDHRRALEHFQRALQLAPGDAAAVEGAGLEAFHIGDYALARNYLGGTTASTGEVAAAREIVELVLNNDPLAARIGAAERRRRLQVNLEHAREAMARCGAPTTANPATGLTGEIDAYMSGLKPRHFIDQDTIEAGLDIISRVESHVTQNCSAAAPLDRALLLIARRHGAAGQ